jgi:hypothetical protein
MCEVVMSLKHYSCSSILKRRTPFGFIFFPVRVILLNPALLQLMYGGRMPAQKMTGKAAVMKG